MLDTSEQWGALVIICDVERERFTFDWEQGGGCWREWFTFKGLSLWVQLQSDALCR